MKNPVEKKDVENKLLWKNCQKKKFWNNFDFFFFFKIVVVVSDSIIQYVSLSLNMLCNSQLAMKDMYSYQNTPWILIRYDPIFFHSVGKYHIG